MNRLIRSYGTSRSRASYAIGYLIPVTVSLLALGAVIQNEGEWISFLSFFTGGLLTGFLRLIPGPFRNRNAGPGPGAFYTGSLLKLVQQVFWGLLILPAGIPAPAAFGLGVLGSLVFPPISSDNRWFSISPFAWLVSLLILWTASGLFPLTACEGAGGWPSCAPGLRFAEVLLIVIPGLFLQQRGGMVTTLPAILVPAAVAWFFSGFMGTTVAVVSVAALFNLRPGRPNLSWGESWIQSLSVGLLLSICFLFADSFKWGLISNFYGLLSFILFLLSDIAIRVYRKF